MDYEYFSQESFERLLFPLHRSVYEKIEGMISEVEQRAPGTYEMLCRLWRRCMKNPTMESIGETLTGINGGFAVF